MEKGLLSEFWDIISHPNETYHRMIANYKKMKAYDGLLVQKSNLEISNSQLVEKNQGLEDKVSNMQGKISDLQGYLINEVPRIKNLVQEAISVCDDLRIGHDVLEARAKENSSDNDKLDVWMEAYAKPLERRMKKAEEKTSFLKENAYGIATDVAISSVIELDSRVKKVPFIFYNNITKQLSYTPATLDFFGISADEANSFNLQKVLRNVNSEFLKGKDGKKGILNALRYGEKLSHYTAKTRGDNPTELKLTTYPVRYGDRDIGFGILVYDPKVSLKTIKNKAFIDSIDKVFQGIAEGLNAKFSELAY